MISKFLRPCAALSILAIAACATASTSSAPSLGPAIADSVIIRNDIAYLASDKLEGRLTGTPGNDSAAAYIARRYASLNLRAAHPGYLQKFVARPAAAAHSGDTAGKATQNVVAILRGSDPRYAGQYIVIGAHYDHLGHETQYAMDPEARNAIRNGADDNASGTAAVMQLARMLSISKPRRSVIFAAFSGEEAGLLGSQYFVDNPPVSLDSIVAMVNFDMVGRLKDEKLLVYGTATATELSAIIDSANARGLPLKVAGGGDGFGSSDQSSFYAKNIPVMHFFTDIHDDYHRATDDVEKINAAGEARVIDLAHRVIESIDDRPSRLTFVRSAPRARVASNPGSGSQAYLGSIPNMSAGTVPGLKLSGVRAGSPADKGGLKADDIIVEFGGASVTDLQTYSDALYKHKPGDTVTVVFLRDGKKMDTSVVLGTLGG